MKNPEIDNNFKYQRNPEQKKTAFLSGSNYQNIIPNIGVMIKEENKSKTGGMNFKNQFGRMSMKEYELLKEKYSQNHEMSYQNKELFYQNDNIDDKNSYKRSESFDNNKQAIKQSLQENISKNNNFYSNFDSNQLHNKGLIHYDWGSDEKTPMSEIINKNFIMNYNKKSSNDKNINKILNENLFKRSITKKHSIYGSYHSDKHVNKEKPGNYLNNFNNQIIQDKNWGSMNNAYQISRSNIHNSRSREGKNMRTRKNI